MIETTHCPFCNIPLRKEKAEFEDTWNWVCPNKVKNYFWHYAICLDDNEQPNGFVVTHKRIHLITRDGKSQLSFFTETFTNTEGQQEIPLVKLDVNNTDEITNKLKLLATFQ